MSEAIDHSWSEQVPYLCVCGTTYPVQRQRWVDADAQPELHALILIDGPLRGQCPHCGEAALGRTTWVEVVPADQRATLVLAAHQRAELVDALKAHLDSISKLTRAVPGWLLQPRWRFEGGREASERSQELSLLLDADAENGLVAAAKVAPAQRSSKPARATKRASEVVSDLNDGVPRMVGARRSNSTTSSSEDGHVALLVLEGEQPTVSVAFKDDARSQWGRAALRVVPIHLRAHGYPLVGVRVVASYLGANSVVDAVVDVADDVANEVFARLSRSFTVRLKLTDLEGNTPVSREVSDDALGRNAALCLESARGVLASEEFPPTAFEGAWASLGAQSCKDRLVQAASPLAPGDFMHLLTPRESLLALEALEAASDKPNLAHLLEHDGLAVSEFEAIRKRVLKGAVEHGLAAPRRFWRRVIASGLAQDAGDYARLLSGARAAWEQGDDDLDETQQQQAWERIRALCVRRDLPFPEELMAALGLEQSAPTPRKGNRQTSAAGEIRVGEAATPVARADRPTPSTGIRAPRAIRAKMVHGIEGLAQAGEEIDLDQALKALEALRGGELLALLPTLAAFGETAVPGLIGALDSGRREVRQCACALLSSLQADAAIRPLVTHLYGEETKVWTDLARSLGAFGPRVLGPVTAFLRDRPPPRPGDEAVLRAARAMAEIAVADEGHGMAQDAVEALADAPQRAVARAAARALATLHEVREAKAQVLGQAAMAKETQVRGFSRRIYEALGLNQAPAAAPAGSARSAPDKTQIIKLEELIELQEAETGDDEVTELDPGELESI